MHQLGLVRSLMSSTSSVKMSIGLVWRKILITKIGTEPLLDYNQPRWWTNSSKSALPLPRSLFQCANIPSGQNPTAIKTNPKYFFTYARKFSKTGTGIGPLMDAAKEIISCPIRIAGKLVEQYTTVFSSPSEPLLSPEEIFRDMEARHATNLCDITDIQFTETDIFQAMAEISSSASAGPDRFPAILLKNCRKILSRPLYKIWRKSLDSGEIPPLMKRANIIPVHKGGSLGLPKNYRPIALTSHLIKVFEKVLRTAIVSYMERNNLYNPSQHGFRHGQSCLSQLIAHYEAPGGRKKRRCYLCWLC